MHLQSGVSFSKVKGTSKFSFICNFASDRIFQCIITNGRGRCSKNLSITEICGRSWGPLLPLCMGYARQCWFGYKYKNCRMFSYLKKSKKVLHFRKINSVTSEKHEKKYKGVKYREKASQDTENIIPKFFSTDGSLTFKTYLRQTCVLFDDLL